MWIVSFQTEMSTKKEVSTCSDIVITYIEEKEYICLDI